MKRFLRRIGGIKRLFFGILAFLAVFYIAQTFVFNGQSSNGNDSGKSGNRPYGSMDNASLVAASTIENKAGLCDVDAVCPSSTLVFTVRSLQQSGDGEQKRPQFCINGKIISSAPTAPKTVSVVVVSGVKRTIDDLKHFDVSVDDKELRDFLLRVAHGNVVFISSAGNVKDKVTEETRSVLRLNFGAGNDTVVGGWNLVFIGQKGLKMGTALEKKDEKAGIGGDVELRGCLQVPMGEMASAPANPAAIPASKLTQVIRNVAIGKPVQNCGLSSPCQTAEVSVAVYSGKNKDDEPRICVDGKMILARNLNNGGRGLNAVVLNATTKQILRVGHFDTYAEDSTSLEVFLEEMIMGEMVVVVSFDEASTHFSSMLKQMFYELGSALVQNLKFRASWFIIGQKGITGFTPYEELNFASGSDWAKPIDRKICVPPFLDGLRVRPDPPVRSRNVPKRHFCEKYDGYEEFCEDSHLDDPVEAAPLINRSLNGNPIFKVPILVVSGLSHNSLRLCLETLVHQPGIDPRSVLVTYDENYPESGELSQLFGFRNKPVTASASYITQVAKSFDALWAQYPDADMAIVLDEELMVTADFLYFMAQMLPILRADPDLMAISAWNVNGYTDTSSLPDLVYRVQGFPGLAYMIRKTTYTKHMQGKMDECCGRRAWEGWNIDVAGRPPQMIVPDVSRVMRRHFDSLGIIDQNLEDMFHRERVYSKSVDRWISNSKSMSSEEIYDSHLKSLILTATPLSARSVLNDCHQRMKPSSSSNSPFFSTVLNSTAAGDSRSYVLYYDESTKDARNTQRQRFLHQFRRCFGLFYSKTADDAAAVSKDGSTLAADSFLHWTHRGLYKGVLRFSYRGHQIFLVGSRSPFYSEGKKLPAKVDIRQPQRGTTDRK